MNLSLLATICVDAESNLDCFKKVSPPGSTTPTVWNWENRGSVDLRFIPRVIEFLGDNPIPQPDDLLEKLAWYKQINGLTLAQLGVEMGRDPEQLANWLSG